MIVLFIYQGEPEEANDEGGNIAVFILWERKATNNWINNAHTICYFECPNFNFVLFTFGFRDFWKLLRRRRYEKTSSATDLTNSDSHSYLCNIILHVFST